MFANRIKYLLQKILFDEDQQYTHKAISDLYMALNDHFRISALKG